MKLHGFFCSVVLLTACGAPDPAGTAATSQALVSPDVLPNGRAMGLYHQFAGPGEARPGGGGGGKNGAGINYHGGPILTAPANVYYVWYGAWAGNTAPTILEDFAANVAPSPYFAINTLYYDGSGNTVQNAVVLAGVANDAYSHGSTLRDADVASVVAGQIQSGALPADPGGVYFVLTSADVAESSGFCSKYCGWHTHTNIGGVDIKFAFVGNPDRCPSACIPTENRTASPNGNPGADSMASIIAHELEEAATDADLNAWYDNRGYENADKCAWTFGTEYPAAGGGQANMQLGSRDYLIQRNWVPATTGGYCALSQP